MNDPRRFLDGEATAREAALLASADDDVPSRGARRQALAALGLAAIPSVPPPALPVAKAASGGLTALVKAALVGAGLGVVTLAAVAPAIHSREHARPLASAVAAPPLARTETPRRSDGSPRAVEAPRPEATVTPAAKVDAPTRPRRPVDTAANPPPPPEQTTAPPPAAPTDPQAPTPAAIDVSTLREETQLLERARQTMTAGPGEALGILDDYDRKYPHGTLHEEAVVLRIQALLGTGDHAGATRLAEEFTRQHPSGPYAARVRALMQ